MSDLSDSVDALTTATNNLFTQNTTIKTTVSADAATVAADKRR